MKKNILGILVVSFLSLNTATMDFFPVKAFSSAKEESLLNASTNPQHEKVLASQNNPVSSPTRKCHWDMMRNGQLKWTCQDYLMITCPRTIDINDYGKMRQCSDEPKGTQCTLRSIYDNDTEHGYLNCTGIINYTETPVFRELTKQQPTGCFWQTDPKGDPKMMQVICVPRPGFLYPGVGSR